MRHALALLALLALACSGRGGDPAATSGTSGTVVARPSPPSATTPTPATPAPANATSHAGETVGGLAPELVGAPLTSAPANGGHYALAIDFHWEIAARPERTQAQQIDGVITLDLDEGGLARLCMADHGDESIHIAATAEPEAEERTLPRPSHLLRGYAGRWTPAGGGIDVTFNRFKRNACDASGESEGRDLLALHCTAVAGGRLPATTLACAATARPTGLDSIWLPLGEGEVAAGGTVGDLPPHGTWWLLGPAPGRHVSLHHALGDAPPVATFTVGDVSLREADYTK